MHACARRSDRSIELPKSPPKLQQINQERKKKRSKKKSTGNRIAHPRAGQDEMLYLVWAYAPNPRAPAATDATRRAKAPRARGAAYTRTCSLQAIFPVRTPGRAVTGDRQIALCGRIQFSPPPHVRAGAGRGVPCPPGQAGAATAACPGTACGRLYSTM